MRECGDLLWMELNDHKKPVPGSFYRMLSSTCVKQAEQGLFTSSASLYFYYKIWKKLTNFIDISVLQDETFCSMIERLIIKNKNDFSKHTQPLLLVQSRQWNLINVNNVGTRTTPMLSFWYLYFHFHINFTHCSAVSHFKHEIAGCLRLKT